MEKSEKPGPCERKEIDRMDLGGALLVAEDRLHAAASAIESLAADWFGQEDLEARVLFSLATDLRREGRVLAFLRAKVCDRCTVQTVVLEVNGGGGGEARPGKEDAGAEDGAAGA
jgi:hypothetical protein